MNEVLQQMHDVHAPDAVSWWPPALGWWILAAALLALIVFGLTSWWWQRKRASDWRIDAAYRMRQLTRSARNNDIRETVSQLSEMLRRVGMARYGRDACAGLVGDEWLQWLTEHDPGKFDWTEKGRILLDLPYLPAGAGAGSQDIRKLVAAAKRWVSTAPEPTVARNQARGLRLRVSVEAD